MTDKDRIEFLWRVNNYVNEYIRFADAKAQMVIGWTSALVGVLIASKLHHKINCSLLGMTCGIGLLLLTGSFISAVLATIPRNGPIRSSGVIYWKNINSFSTFDQYADHLRSMSEAELVDHTARQVFDISGIAEQKFLCVQRAIWLALAGSALSGFVYLFL
jgi:hypothetical protein